MFSASESHPYTQLSWVDINGVRTVTTSLVGCLPLMVETLQSWNVLLVDRGANVNGRGGGEGSPFNDLVLL